MKDEAWQVGHIATQLSFTCYRATAIPPKLSAHYSEMHRYETGRDDGFSSIAYTIHEHEAFPLVLNLPWYHNEIAPHEPITHTCTSYTIMKT